MAFHVKDDFRPGAPVSQVPASWFNRVGSFLNNLVGGYGVKVEKSERGASTVSLDASALPSSSVSKETGTPDDRTAEDAGDSQDGEAWTWTAGGGGGLRLDVFCRARPEDGWHYFGRARLVFSKDGLLVSAEGLADETEIEG